MKLSTKISGGFSVILAVAIVLTGISLSIMRGVSKEAQVLSNQYMPQTRMANEVERYVLHTISEMRAYDFSYEDSFLSASRQQLDQVRNGLQEAAALTAKYPELKTLKDSVGEAVARISEYEALVNDMEKAGKEIHGIRKKLDAVAQGFTKACLEFLDEQTEEMKNELKTGAPQEQLTERLDKIRGMNEVVELGYTIQLETSKGQLLRDPKIIEEAAKKFTEMENEVNAIQKKTTKDTTISQLEDIRMASSNYKTNMKKLLQNYATLTDLGQKRSLAGGAVSGSAKAIATTGIGETSKSALKVERLLSDSAKILLIVAAMGILLSVVLIFLITRGITRPVKRIIEGLTEGADQVSSGSSQVASASQSLSEGASSQAASIEETSSSLEEMSSMTKQNADNATQADSLMKSANQVVNKANESMGKLTTSMEEISRASEETSKIIKTIDEIAFQTNLLALNAAVEAARAGEAGAGFAVVAGEVRNLAIRAADAAKNTANLIEGTVKKVKEGSVLVTSTNEAFTEVARSAAKVGELVAEIAAASGEQAQGIEQVNMAVAEMDKVVQQVAASAEESASASEEMNAQAEQMKGVVDELVTLVGGSGKGNVRAGSAAPSRPLSEHPPKRSPSKEMVLHGKSEVSPDKVIPMDEAEFREF